MRKVVLNLTISLDGELLMETINLIGYMVTHRTIQ